MLVLMITFRLVLRRRMLLRVRVLRRMLCRVRIGVLCRMRVGMRRRSRLLRVLLRRGFLCALRFGATRLRCVLRFRRMLRFRLSMFGLRVFTFRCTRRLSILFGRPGVVLFRLRMLGFALRTRHSVFVSFVRMLLLFGLWPLRGGARCVLLLFGRVRRVTRLRFVAASRCTLRTDRVSFGAVNHMEACRSGHGARRARMAHGSEGRRRRRAHYRCANAFYLAAARSKALRERVVIGRRHDRRAGGHDLTLRERGRCTDVSRTQRASKALLNRGDGRRAGTDLRMREGLGIERTRCLRD